MVNVTERNYSTVSWRSSQIVNCTAVETFLLYSLLNDRMEPFWFSSN